MLSSCQESANKRAVLYVKRLENSRGGKQPKGRSNAASSCEAIRGESRREGGRRQDFVKSATNQIGKASCGMSGGAVCTCLVMNRPTAHAMAWSCQFEQLGR